MKILLALDGSDESMAAARFVARLPFREKPEVTVVTALVDAPYDLVTTDAGVALREAEGAAAGASFKLAEEILAGKVSQLNHVVERQHPSRLIMTEAKSRDIDLIVLGARGHSAVYRVVLGSTADYVTNHAKCSVVVVRPEPEETASEDFRVMLAYDGSAGSKHAYARLCELDWSPGSKLHIAMMLERPKLIPEDEVYDQVAVDDSEKSLAALEASAKLRCELTHSVRETLHVGSAIRVLAEREESNLLVVGGSGKSAIARFFLGSTSRYLLHHAECSVVIAREKQWDA